MATANPLKAKRTTRVLALLDGMERLGRFATAQEDAMGTPTNLPQPVTPEGFELRCDFCDKEDTACKCPRVYRMLHYVRLVPKRKRTT